MLLNIDRLLDGGCAPGKNDKKEKLCRSRGGESCAFDGAMIVLQPIGDTAHIVHGPSACCGNSWEGRGTLSKAGEYRDTPLHRMGFTTDISDMDVVYGSEERLYRAIIQTFEAVRPKAIFVYATCVTGLIGEDIDAVCRKAEAELGIKVIPVNAPGFLGPKNLGNRVAGEVLLEHVIGNNIYGDSPDSTASPVNLGQSPLWTGRPDKAIDGDINLIGEYNIAGDLWLVEPVLKEAGIKFVARITGNSTFEEITNAHRARLNVVVCGRALVNVAKVMERRYGIPYIEASFFGKSEMSRALRLMASALEPQRPGLTERVERVVRREEKLLESRLSEFSHLKGKRAVLYTGGVKSWSFISALLDLGIEVVGVGTKKSSFEDEEKMKEILGKDAPIADDVTPKNLLKMIRDRKADLLVAGGRNQYLAVKEGIPFVDVNQERHAAYAGYEGLINFARQISGGMRFYSYKASPHPDPLPQGERELRDIVINPLRHSPSIGAAIAFQGIHRAMPVIHGAQGCSFLGKVLLTKHFREPVSLSTTKLFTEDVVMGSEGNLIKVVEGIVKDSPDVVGVLTSGLTEVKGDDTSSAVRGLDEQFDGRCRIVHVPTPDYEGGLETGYRRAVEAIIGSIVEERKGKDTNAVNVLAGSHLTPADFTELREIIESFGLKAVILPDLSALDGSRKGFSQLAIGGTTVEDIKGMGSSAFTLAIGASMEGPAKMLKERFGIGYEVFDSISGLNDTDTLMAKLALISGRQTPSRYERQRRILVDGMRDAHFRYIGKKACIALEPDLAVQSSHWLEEMGVDVDLAVIPPGSETSGKIAAKEVVTGDLFSIEGKFDLMISNSHAEDTAKWRKVPLYQVGFPVYKVLGNTARVNIGYRGTLAVINEAANLLAMGGNT